MKYELEFSKQLNNYKTFTGNLHVNLELLSKISMTYSVPIMRKSQNLSEPFHFLTMETQQVSKTLHFNTKLMWLVTHNNITRMKPQNKSQLILATSTITHHST